LHQVIHNDVEQKTLEPENMDLNSILGGVVSNALWWLLGLVALAADERG
jgi:hypothetical protein